MSPWSTAGISLIEAFGDVGTPYGEIETVFYLDDFGPMFGNDQDADILYSTTIGQMILGVPADAGDNEPILNIVPHTAGVTYSSDPATVLDAVHPTVVIWDSGVTDLIAFYNDDTLSHILSEVAGGVEVDIGLWLGDATGDQAKVRIYGYDEAATAAAYYTIGTHDDGNDLLSLQIGLLTTTAGTRNFVICDVGATPALNVDVLNTAAHAKLSIWDSGATDWIALWNDDSVGHIQVYDGADQNLQIFIGDTAGDVANIQIVGYGRNATATQTLYLGGDEETTSEHFYWRIGVPARVASEKTHCLVVQQANTALPAANALDFIQTVAHPIFAVFDSGNTDAIVLYNTDTVGMLQAIDDVAGMTLSIQGITNTIPGDVTFFAGQSDPGTTALAAGTVPEIRIYGWDHADTALNQVILRVLSVEEGIDPTDDETTYFNIAIDSTSSRMMIITDDSAAIPEITVAASHPTLRIYDSGNTDYLQIFDDDTYSWIVGNPNPINIAPSNDIDNYIRFSTVSDVPGFASIAADMDIQNLAGTLGVIYDVTFFANQADPATGVLAAGSVPEIRIYGWDHADTSLRYTVLRTSSVAETVDPTDDEHSFFMIGVDPLGTRKVIICDGDETTIEIIAVSAHPTLALFDAGATDYLQFYDDGTYSWIVANPNPLNIAPNNDVDDYIQFTTQTNVPGFTTIGDADLSIQNQAAANPFDVMFFASQTVPVATPAAGSTPEVRIYGWSSATINAQVYSAIWTGAVPEGHAETNNEIGVMYINPANNYLILANQGAAANMPEITAAATHATLRIYDSGWTDYLDLYNDDTNSFINSAVNDLIIQGNAATAVYDVEFFSKQTDPGSAVTGVGEVPEIRIYGWCHVDGDLRYTVLRTSAVAEGVDPTDNEHAFFTIGVDPLGSRFIVISDADETTIEITAVAAHPTLRIYDAGATDFIQMYDDGAIAYIETNANPIYMLAETGVVRFRDADDTDNTNYFEINIAADGTYVLFEHEPSGIFRFQDAGDGDDSDIFQIEVTDGIGFTSLRDETGVIRFSDLDDADTSEYLEIVTTDGGGEVILRTPAANNLVIQGIASTTPGDVEFFSKQIDPGTDVAAAGEVPEIRIYGWSHVGTVLDMVTLRVLSVAETVDPTDDEYTYFNIHVDATGSRGILITDDGSAVPELAAQLAHPTLRIYDSGNTDYIQFYDDDTYSWIVVNPNPLNIAPSNDVDDYIQFDTKAGIPGFTTIGDADLSIQNQAAANPFDVMFFASQTVPAATPAAGSTPEIRIYGWSSATINTQVYSAIWTGAVPEGHAETNNEISVMYINPANNYLILANQGAAANMPEITAAATHATLRIYDSGWTDYLDLYNDDTNSFINSVVNDLIIQGNAATTVYNVEFFSKQTDPGTGVMAAGEVPEIRIYGWDHADTAVHYTVLRTSSVAETVDPTDDEHSFFMIGVDSTGSRKVVICDAHETTIEITAVATHPTLAIYDAAATDFIQMYDDGAIAYIETNANPIYMLPETGVVRFRDADDTDNTLYLEISTPLDGTYVQLLESGNSLMTQVLILGYVDSRPTVSGTHGAEIHGFTGVAAGAAGKGRLTSGAGTISYFTMTGATDETNHVTIGFDVPDLAIDSGTAADFTIEIEFDPDADGDKFDIALHDSVYGFIGTQTITASGAGKQWSTVFNVGALSDTGTFAKGDSLILYITKCTDSARTGGANADFYRVRMRSTVGIEIDTA